MGLGDGGAVETTEREGPATTPVFLHEGWCCSSRAGGRSHVCSSIRSFQGTLILLTRDVELVLVYQPGDQHAPFYSHM